jgi:hypothetical protein
LADGAAGGIELQAGVNVVQVVLCRRPTFFA